MRIAILLAAVLLIGCAAAPPKPKPDYAATFAPKTAVSTETLETIKEQLTHVLAAFEYNITESVAENGQIVINFIENNTTIAELNATLGRIIEFLNRDAGLMQIKFQNQTLITTNDIVKVITDPMKGYGITTGQNNLYWWELPFNITEEAAERFAAAVEGKCTETDGRCAEYVEEYIRNELISTIYLTPGITQGEPITNPVIVGSNETVEGALENLRRAEIALSPRLPAELKLIKLERIST